jgi:hypothetical protein
MIKFRLTGLPVNVQTAMEQLKSSFSVLSASPVYHNRNSKYVRIYVNVDFKPKNGSCESVLKQL